MEIDKKTKSNIWSGRIDKGENKDSLRIFQGIYENQMLEKLENCKEKIALLGFECDEGVTRNQGRAGAAYGPDIIRKNLANMTISASYNRKMMDIGNVSIKNKQLVQAQKNLCNKVAACQKNSIKTLVIGGGHETALGHAIGIFESFPNKKITIINLDSHLDLRIDKYPNSGTPFYQIASYCKKQSRDFLYNCIGTSFASNTDFLRKIASQHCVKIIEDLTVLNQLQDYVLPTLREIINSSQKIYLSIDLDVLPCWQMPAVSSPASLGVPLHLLLNIITPICSSEKLQGVDIVEFNPRFDLHEQSARIAARIVWHIFNYWK